MALFYNNQIELLKGIAIFQDLLEEDLHFIASHMRQITFKAGDILFQEGDPGEEMFVVIKGGVSVFIETNIDTEFKMTAEQLEAAITPKTKAVLYSSPCNPSGSYYTREELERWAEEAGLDVLDVLDGLNLGNPTPKSERWLFVTKNRVK